MHAANVDGRQNSHAIGTSHTEWLEIPFGTKMTPAKIVAALPPAMAG